MYISVPDTAIESDIQKSMEAAAAIAGYTTYSGTRIYMEHPYYIDPDLQRRFSELERHLQNNRIALEALAKEKQRKRRIIRGKR